MRCLRNVQLAILARHRHPEAFDIEADADDESRRPSAPVRVGRLYLLNWRGAVVLEAPLYDDGDRYCATLVGTRKSEQAGVIECGIIRFDDPDRFHPVTFERHAQSFEGGEVRAFFDKREVDTTVCELWG